VVVDERGYQFAGLTRFQRPPGGAAIELPLTSRAEPGGTSTNDQVMRVHDQREGRSEMVISGELSPQLISGAQGLRGLTANWLRFSCSARTIREIISAKPTLGRQPSCRAAFEGSPLE
jgi:hypothetical protein